MAQALVFAIGAVTRIELLADHFTVRCGRRGYSPLAAVANVRGPRCLFVLVRVCSWVSVCSQRFLSSSVASLAKCALPMYFIDYRPRNAPDGLFENRYISRKYTRNRPSKKFICQLSS